MSRRLLANAGWQTLSVATTTAVAVILPPMMVRGIGPESFGIWILTFSFIEYSWMFDVGFTAAVNNYTSRLAAAGDMRRLGEVVSTALLFFVVMATCFSAGFVFVVPKLPEFFNVSAASTADFLALMWLVGFSMVTAQVLRCFPAVLEGMQRFDITSRVRIVTTVTRSTALIGGLYAGASLPVLGLITVAFNTLSYCVLYIICRKVIPELRISLSLASVQTLRELARYGMRAFLIVVSNIVLNFSATGIIGRFRPVAEVGYYTLVPRILQQFIVLADGAALVLAPRTAALDSTGQRHHILNLVTTVNRYTLSLFIPFGTMLLVYGRELITLWINRDMAAHAAPLIPVVTAGVGLSWAAQSAVRPTLFGMAELKHYSWVVAAEAAVTVALSIFAVQRYGLIGVASVFAITSTLSMGLMGPYILCRHVHESYARYMARVYTGPLLCGIPVYLLALYLKATVLPGNSWGDLIAAAAIVGLLSATAAFFICLIPAHRDALVQRAARLL